MSPHIADLDHELLSKQKLELLNSDEGYVSGEDAKREFGLQVDLPGISPAFRKKTTLSKK
ncbi:hypothetical protein [Bacillus mycoides]|uniref:Uncharacterized protein n=1 Tax=Bacillus mycoides TaxID=1405 RepID=A0A1G4EZC6_BACMY|nr:hypothetical protein [Bacillus mycoides]SCB71556.1 Uncharacterized protein BWGO95_05803 [Bacillus mycoides]